jgi:hypothetical protein
MMAEITTGTPIGGPISSTQAAAVAPSFLQKAENWVFAFLQAHYFKLVSAGAGYGLAKIGIFTLIGKLL